MKIKCLLLALCVFLFLGSEVRAQPPGTMSWGQGQPVGGQGKVTGSGTYTVACCWNATSFALNALPVGGGQASSTVGQACGANWGPIVINNLAAGQYTVYGSMTVKMGNTVRTITTPTSIVTVN
jgi:hypothetical protein